MRHSDPRSAADDIGFALYRLLLELRFAAHPATLGDTRALKLPGEYLAITLNGSTLQVDPALAMRMPTVSNR